MATKKRDQTRSGSVMPFRPLVHDPGELQRRMRTLFAAREFEQATALARPHAHRNPLDYDLQAAFAMCLVFTSQFAEAAAILMSLFYAWPARVAADNSLFWALMCALVHAIPQEAVYIVEKCVAAGTMTAVQGYRWIRYVGQYIGDFAMVRDAAGRILPSLADAFPTIPEVHRADGTIQFPEISPALPCYTGGSVEGQTLVIYDGSGFGDCFFSVRWLATLKSVSKARHIVFVVRPELAEFARSFARDAEIVARGEDEYVPEGPAMFSLLVSLTTVIAPARDEFWSGPYITAPLELATLWRQRLDAECGTESFKVGIVREAGHAGVEPLSWRNMQANELAPLAGIHGVSIVSLQKGKAENHCAEIPGALSFASDITSFEDTAAIIANLDLVITVDCGVANLAGAMGARTWLLLEPMHDGRYGLGATPDFYPTLRAFRQRVRGNWSAVIADVAKALRELVASRDCNVTRLEVQGIAYP